MQKSHYPSVKKLKTKEKNKDSYVSINYLYHENSIEVLDTKYMGKRGKHVVNLNKIQDPNAVEFRQTARIVADALKGNEEKSRYSEQEIEVLKTVYTRYNNTIN